MNKNKIRLYTLKFADTFDFSQTTQAREDGPTDQQVAARELKIDEREQQIEGVVEVLGPKIEALAEIICRGGDESAGALFVLMGTLQHSTNPEVLANTAKHLAFTRCGEFNLFGMVDAQIAVLESELLAHGTSVS